MLNKLYLIHSIFYLQATVFIRSFKFEFISTKILFIILLIIILGIALYSEYLKHLYRKAIKTIAYDLNPEKANKQFNELLKKTYFTPIKMIKKYSILYII